MRTRAAPSCRGRRRIFRRDRKGQVAAIATLFGLLIVVSLISELAIAPLPVEEQNAELQHQLLVENQLGEVQSDLRLEVTSKILDPRLSAPITLGSAAIPPFGPAAPSTLTLTPNGPSTALTADVVRPGPISGTGALCSSPYGSLATSGGTTTCTDTANGCPTPGSWNISLTGATYMFNLKGNSGSCQWINVTGDGNTITILQTANSLSLFNFTIYGSDNTVTVEWQGSTTANVQFNLYGSGNTFQYGSGGTFDGNSVGVITRFIGETEPQGANGCPYQNLAATDTVGPLKTSGKSDTQSLLFYNSVGVTNSHSVTPSGSPSLTWQDISETATPPQCAYGGTGPTGIFSPLFIASGALGIGLENHYLGPLSISLEDGALVSGNGNGSLLVEPPFFNFSTNGNGVSANLTFVSFVEVASSTVSGFATTAILTQLLSETRFSAAFPLNVSGSTLLTAPALNITTEFPIAWQSYFAGLPASVLGGTVGCSSAAPIAPPYSCLNPPAGRFVTLSVPLDVSWLTVTSAVIQISVD